MLLSSLSWDCKRFVCTRGTFASPLPKFLPLTEGLTCNNPPCDCSDGSSPPRSLYSTGSSELGRSGLFFNVDNSKAGVVRLLHTDSELQTVISTTKKISAIAGSRLLRLSIKQIQGGERERGALLALGGHDFMFVFKAQVGLQVPKN